MAEAAGLDLDPEEEAGGAIRKGCAEKWLDTDKRLEITFPKVAGKAVERLMKKFGSD